MALWFVRCDDRVVWVLDVSRSASGMRTARQEPRLHARGQTGRQRLHSNLSSPKNSSRPTISEANRAIHMAASSP